MSGFPAHFVHISRCEILMSEIKVLSFAKINLSIDVTGVRDDGMHLVDMIMQQLAFHDEVIVKFDEDLNKSCGEIQINLTTNRSFLPCDNRNLAYRAAELVIRKYGEKVPGGTLSIHLEKRIPVAAGLAGGSGNCAAVLHALNTIWRLGLGLDELCEMSKTLGSDIAFCLMGQAACNRNLPYKVRKSKNATSCARATGTGVDLIPLRGIRKAVVLAKPALGVSTKEVYQGIDTCEISKHPDNEALIEGLAKDDYNLIYENCVNVLENYTLKTYPKVQELKSEIMATKKSELVLMSGSGPTVFALFDRMEAAKEVCHLLRKKGYESYWTKTTKI